MASKTLRCHLCQVEVDESTIKRHISSFHLHYRPYDCSTCTENGDIHKTATEEAMDAHIVTAHSARNVGYLVCKEASKESELNAVAEECVRLSALRLSEGSATKNSGNEPTSNEMGKGISIQEQNDDSQTVIDKEDRLQNPTTSTQSASDARSLYSNPQSASDTKSKPAKKMELSMITIEISIDRGCASFETSDGKKYPSDGKKGPLSEYLSILRQSKVQRSCETHITFDPSRFVWNDAETVITAREKFEKFSQEIHSIAHLWKYGRVVAKLHKYPKRAKKVFALSDFCKGLFGQGRSILACRELEITLSDDWPFSVVTNIAPSRRLIVKEMHQDHLSEDQQLHCAFLDALYDKKIPQHIDVILFLYHNKSTTKFNDELKKRFQLSTGMDFEFKVLSPRVIPNMVDRNKHGTIEIKSSIPLSGHAQYIARITQRSFSRVPDQQPV